MFQVFFQQVEDNGKCRQEDQVGQRIKQLDRRRVGDGGLDVDE